jgi:hypothetical protein
MRSKSDFWLHLHQLASDLDREGRNVEEQAEGLADNYDGLSEATRAVYGENLETVMKALTTIALRCKVKRRSWQ